MPDWPNHPTDTLPKCPHAPLPNASLQMPNVYPNPNPWALTLTLITAGA